MRLHRFGLRVTLAHAEWGLVNRMVAPQDLLSAAQDMARPMLAGDPQTLLAYKQLLDDEAGTTLLEAFELERAASLAHNSPVSRALIDARLLRLRKKG